MSKYFSVRCSNVKFKTKEMPNIFTVNKLTKRFKNYIIFSLCNAMKMTLTYVKYFY